jgi:hypothetical protein
MGLTDRRLQCSGVLDRSNGLIRITGEVTQIQYDQLIKPSKDVLYTFVLIEQPVKVTSFTLLLVHVQVPFDSQSSHRHNVVKLHQGSMRLDWSEYAHFFDVPRYPLKCTIGRWPVYTIACIQIRALFRCSSVVLHLHNELLSRVYFEHAHFLSMLLGALTSAQLTVGLHVLSPAFEYTHYYDVPRCSHNCTMNCCPA